jgi:hypothetical protein
MLYYSKIVKVKSVMKKLLIIFIIVVLAGGAVSLILNFVLPASAKKVTVNTGKKSVAVMMDNYSEQDFEKMNPLEFLHSLEKNTGVVTTILFAPDGWIKSEHVSELIKLVDSKKPCAAVVSALSSFLPAGGSTVGNEAMFLIDGYKCGKYPPALYSAGGTVNRNPEEYKKWWKETGLKNQEFFEARQRCEIVYLSPEKNPRLSVEETTQETKIYTVHSQKELEESTDGLQRRYVIWIDMGAAGLADKEWLYGKTVDDKIPVIFIGCSNTITAFRDILQLYRSMHGPKIPEEVKNIDGFCVYRFFEEVKTENSLTINALSRGFPGKPVLKDVMNISRKINDGRQLLKYSDGFSPEQKAQYYYWALRSDPKDKKAESGLISILPQISWTILSNDDMDDPFNIMLWFKEQSVKGSDSALISLMKSRSGLDGAPAEGYFAYIADVLESNPLKFIKLLASLGQNDIDDISLHISYEAAHRKELAEKLKSLPQSGLSFNEKEIVLKLLGDK